MKPILPQMTSIDADIHLKDFYDKKLGKNITIVGKNIAIDCYDLENRKEILQLTLYFHNALMYTVESERKGSPLEKWYMFAGESVQKAFVLGFAPYSRGEHGYMHTFPHTFSKDFSVTDPLKEGSFLRRYMHGCEVNITETQLQELKSMYGDQLQRGAVIIEIDAYRKNTIHPVTYHFIPVYIHTFSLNHSISCGYMYGNSMPLVIETIGEKSYVFFPKAEDKYRPPMRALTNARQTVHKFS